MQKFQIHQSALTMAASCGEKFRRRYIEGERGPIRSYLAVGSAVDASVTANLGNRIERGEALPKGMALDTAFDKASRLLEDFEPEPDEGDREAAKGAALDKTTRLAGAHYDKIAPQIEPLDVARSFVLELPEPMGGFELVGEIDVLASAGDDTQVRDTKTSKRTPKQDTADSSLQLTMYHFAEKVTTGRPPASLALDYVVDLKRETKALTLTTTRTAADTERLFNRVAVLVQQIETGVFHAANPADWRCSAKYCEYYHDCRFAANPVTSGNPGLVRNITPAKSLEERLRESIAAVNGDEE